MWILEEKKKLIPLLNVSQLKPQGYDPTMFCNVLYERK